MVALTMRLYTLVSSDSFLAFSSDVPIAVAARSKARTLFARSIMDRPFHRIITSH
jgi:hypothetical protein